MIIKNIEAYKIIIEPGDKTRYCFIIGIGSRYLHIAGSPRFDLYEYVAMEIPACMSRIENNKKWYEDYYIEYIVSHSNCNQWTARAMVLAVDGLLNKSGPENKGMNSEPQKMDIPM